MARPTITIWKFPVKV